MGSLTPYKYLYLPAYGEYGETNLAAYNAAMQAVDSRLANCLWVGDPYFEDAAGATWEEKLINAIDTIGSTNMWLGLPPMAAFNITQDISVPANITLHIPPLDDPILINSGKKFVIHGSVNAGRYQIFSGSGRALVVGTCPYLVEWRGAVADGSTDYATEIQAAIDDVEAVAALITDGGLAKPNIISFGPGHYVFGTKLTVQQTSIALTGQGSGTWQTSGITSCFDIAPTILEYTGTATAIEFGDAVFTRSGMWAKGFYLILSAATINTIGIDFLDHCHSHCGVDDIYVRGSYVGDTLTDYVGIGLKVGDKFESNQIVRSAFFYLNIGILIKGYCDTLCIDSCKIIRTSTAGIKLGDDASSFLTGWAVTIQNCQIGINNIGIWAYRTTRSLNIINNYNETSRDPSYRAIVLGDTADRNHRPQNVLIAGNSLTTAKDYEIPPAFLPADYGIELRNCKNVKIINNAHTLFAEKLIYNCEVDNAGADIEGLSRANPCVVTWTAHGLQSGDKIRINGITDANWTALNGTIYEITRIGDDSFSIAVNTLGYAGDYVPASDPGKYYIQYVDHVVVENNTRWSGSYADLNDYTGITKHSPSNENFDIRYRYKAGEWCQVYRVQGDSYNRLQLDSAGYIQAGSGAGTVDTSLYRSAADTWYTPDEFLANGGIGTKVKAGVPADGDFATATNGLMAVDSTNGRLYFRHGAAWHYCAQDAGFQINAKDNFCHLSGTGKPFKPGDLVLGIVTETMSDGASHCEYVSLREALTLLGVANSLDASGQAAVEKAVTAAIEYKDVPVEVEAAEALEEKTVMEPDPEKTETEIGYYYDADGVLQERKIEKPAMVEVVKKVLKSGYVFAETEGKFYRLERPEWSDASPGIGDGK